MKKIDRRSFIFGLQVFSRSKLQLLNEISQRLFNLSKITYIFTPNPEQIVQSQEDSQFLSILNQADYLIPDGIGLIYASKVLSWFGKAQALQERITGVDLVEDLLEVSKKMLTSSGTKSQTQDNNRNLNVMLVGGQNYDRELVSKYGQRHRLNFSWLPGYSNIRQKTQKQEQALIQAIKKLKPAIVFVAFGAPDQEQWAIEHKQLLQESKVKLVMVIGGGFDLILGKIKRAPTWMKKLGFEWIFRLVQEPWRWKRQLRLVKFVGLVFRELFKKNLI